MSTQTVISHIHPAFTKKNIRVRNFFDPVIRSLIADLTDTMRSAELVGIAAPQIAQNYQVFLTEPRKTAARSGDQVDQLRIYINPKIVEVSSETIMLYEGCGSVWNPPVFAPVIRPRQVTVEAYDEQGKKFSLTANGLLGRILQHEMDHLLGTVFLQKVRSDVQLLSLEEYTVFKKNSPELTEAANITTLIHRYA